MATANTMETFLGDCASVVLSLPLVVESANVITLVVGVAGVAFTSQTAVQACEAALSSSWRNGKGSSEEANSSSWREQLVEQWSSCPVFVVGKATASEVGELVQRCTWYQN